MAKNEAKIRFTAETGDLNSEIKKANDTMSRLRAELKLNETQMKSTGASVEALENKHKILSSQLAASESKTEALAQKVSKAAEIFGENSTEVNKLRTQLANAQTAEEKIRQAISACNDELEAQRSAASEVETATEKLTSTISEQQRQLDKLKGEYVDVVLQYGETSDEAKALESSISELSGELKQSKTALSNAADRADELDQSLDKVDDSADNAGDGFTVLKGVVADLASSAIQAAIGKLSEFIGYLGQLPAETMELRQSMSTLTTAFDGANLSTTQAKDTWKELYAVFGDDQTAVEAANHIARMSENQQDLNDWVTISTGLYATYQDAINPAAIAESAKETAACGKVTGQFADALNWSSEAAAMFAGYMSEDVTTAEDAFNVALSECSTEQERQALITDTLTALYGDAANTYRDTAGAQMEAKKATAEHMLVENNLASAIEPVTTAWTEMKSALLNELQPAIEKVSGLMVGALEWAKEHPVAMKAIAAAVGVLAVGLGGLAIAAGVYTAAQWAMNSAILANPITWIIVGVIAAIAAVIAAIVVVVEYWDEIVAACSNAWNKVKEILAGWGEWINTNVIQPVVNFFTNLWSSIQNIWNQICNVVQVAIMFIGSIISAAVQIITLPFRLIWENCKQYVFAAFEWIKETIQNWREKAVEIFNNFKEKAAEIFSAIKEKIVTPIQNAYQKGVEIFNNLRNNISEKISALREKVSSIFNSIKEKIMTPIQNAKSAAVNLIENLRSSFSSKIESLRSKVSSIFSSIKEKITSPIETAKNKVKSMVDSITGFFKNMKISLPKIKLPHFKITGKLSISPPSVPKLSIEWYKDGGIMMKPTIFGMNGHSLMAGGEAGPEAILPIDRLEGYIAGAIEKTMNVVNLDSLAAAVEELASRPVQLNINGRQFALATAGDGDSVNGLRSTFKSRGLVLD